MDYKVFSTELAGRPLTIEFGKYAQQANGSAFVRYGDTVVMVNATMSEKPREGVDFFPLSVDFEEKQYSVGKIPGGFIKREGRPTEKATLTCRLIDRPLRPLFPKGMRNDVQVVATCLSVDKDIPPEVPAMIGSSAALSVSDIPWGGPTGTVVVGCVDGELVLCPDAAQREKSTLHLTVSGTRDAVLMVEAGAREVPEELMLRAILFGHEEIKKLVAFIEGIRQEIGKEKAEVALITTGEDVKAAVREYAYDKCRWVFETTDRHERQEREAQVKAECEEHFAEQFEGRLSEVDDALYYLNKEIMRARILTEGVRPDRPRPDRRAPHLVRGRHSAPHARPAPSLPAAKRRPSPSQPSDSRALRVQILDGLGTEDFKRYIHHYNMPPYATGEAGRMKSPGRREIGHGAGRARPGAGRARRGRVPLRAASGERDPLLQRLQLHGLRLRQHAEPHGRGRAHQAPRGRRGHGPHQGRGDRQGRRAHRHSGPGGLPGRHGLQGGRHRQGHHRHPDGYQDRRHRPRDSGKGAQPGAGGPPAHPQDHAGYAGQAARAPEPLRAQDRALHHQPRKDPARSSDRAAR